MSRCSIAYATRPRGWGGILDQWFRSHGMGTALKSRFRLVLTDGSTIQRPGSKGSTWRLPAQWHLSTGQWEHVALTDTHGAESLMRLRLRADEVVVADRNYAKPPALAGIRAQKAPVIVRFGWKALRFPTLPGEPWSVLKAVRGLREATPGDWGGQIPGDQRPARPHGPHRGAAQVPPQRPKRRAGRRARMLAIMAIPSRQKRWRRPIMCRL